MSRMMMVLIVVVVVLVGGMIVLSRRARTKSSRRVSKRRCRLESPGLSVGACRRSRCVADRRRPALGAAEARIDPAAGVRPAAGADAAPRADARRAGRRARGSAGAGRSPRRRSQPCPARRRRAAADADRRRDRSGDRPADRPPRSARCTMPARIVAALARPGRDRARRRRRQSRRVRQCRRALYRGADAPHAGADRVALGVDRAAPRLLAQPLNTPRNVNGADFAAERAFLLLRMGESVLGARDRPVGRSGELHAQALPGRDAGGAGDRRSSARCARWRPTR